MAKSRDIGRKGEDEAVRYLEDHGYVILERNYRFRRNEIDIVAKQNNILVFVEVKFRSSNAFGFPESFVTDEQAERIMDAADEFQYVNNWSGSIRFDIISIEKNKQNLKITHFKDAIQ